jgi:hypothetical protein
MRLKKAVIAKYAMDGEGANLSGLPENPPRVEEALYKMVEEEFKGKVRIGKKQEKEADRAKRMQEIQDKMLKTMVRAAPTSVATPRPAPGGAAAVGVAAGGAAAGGATAAAAAAVAPSFRRTSFAQ